MIDSATRKNILGITTQIFWKCMEKYTYALMFWKKYAIPVIKRYLLDEKEIHDRDYPFLLVNDNNNNLSHVYYYEIEPANFKFIQTQIEVNGKKHEIDLSQFMAVNNVLFHYGFARWILKEQTGIEINDNEPYTVHIIDQNADIYEVSNSECIIIYKDKCVIENQEDNNEGLGTGSQEDNNEGLGTGSQEDNNEGLGMGSQEK